MKSSLIEILVIECSSSVTKILNDIIQLDPKLKIVATFSNGEDALSYLHYTQVDVIIIDKTLPHMDGFETTRKIMQTHPVPIIMINTDLQQEEARNSFKAFQSGALEIINLSLNTSDQAFTTQAKALIKAILNASIIKLTTRCYFHQYAAQVTPEEKIENLLTISPIKAIAIGASLGGPTALKKIFSQVPAEFPIPIFVVQHIAAGFNQSLVHWIQTTSPLKITLAQEGQIVRPGTVYIAPENFHLEILPYHTIHLSSDLPYQGLRPSVGRLFRSMAKAYGKQSMGIILTGMGRDGAADLLLMKNQGAITIAQDQNTSFVFGMPKEAIALGAAQFVLSLDQIIKVLKVFKK